jgi:hypothetical protein
MTQPLKSHPLYTTFGGIRQRCLNVNFKQYDDYGGRGITVHQAWLKDPWLFIAYVERELGPKPPKSTIDRIDNDKGYEPGNIQWASRVQNARNKRNNRLVTINGTTKCVAEWAQEHNLTIQTIHTRLTRGWAVDRLLIPPTRKSTR